MNKKKLFITLFFSLFLVGLVSAETTFFEDKFGNSSGYSDWNEWEFSPCTMRVEAYWTSCFNWDTSRSACNEPFEDGEYKDYIICNQVEPDYGHNNDSDNIVKRCCHKTLLHDTQSTAVSKWWHLRLRGNGISWAALPINTTGFTDLTFSFYRSMRGLQNYNEEECLYALYSTNGGQNWVQGTIHNNRDDEDHQELCYGGTSSPDGYGGKFIPYTPPPSFTVNLSEEASNNPDFMINFTFTGEEWNKTAAFIDDVSMNGNCCGAEGELQRSSRIVTLSNGTSISCSWDDCCPVLEEENGICTMPCGTQGKTCYNNSDCCDNLFCDQYGKCFPCGVDGLSCSNNEECCQGFFCNMSTDKCELNFSCSSKGEQCIMDQDCCQIGEQLFCGPDGFCFSCNNSKRDYGPDRTQVCDSSCSTDESFSSVCDGIFPGTNLSQEFCSEQSLMKNPYCNDFCFKDYRSVLECNEENTCQSPNDVSVCNGNNYLCTFENNTWKWMRKEGIKENCSDGLDNDCDGLIDCVDPDPDCPCDCDVSVSMSHECDLTNACEDSCNENELVERKCSSSCICVPLITKKCNEENACFGGEHSSCGGKKYYCTYDGSWKWMLSKNLPVESLGKGNCKDGFDNDCDGLIDDKDSDCTSSSGKEQPKKEEEEEQEEKNSPPKVFLHEPNQKEFFVVQRGNEWESPELRFNLTVSDAEQTSLNCSYQIDSKGPWIPLGDVKNGSNVISFGVVPSIKTLEEKGEEKHSIRIKCSDGENETVSSTSQNITLKIDPETFVTRKTKDKQFFEIFLPPGIVDQFPMEVQENLDLLIILTIALSVFVLSVSIFYARSKANQLKKALRLEKQEEKRKELAEMKKEKKEILFELKRLGKLKMKGLSKEETENEEALKNRLFILQERLLRKPVYIQELKDKAEESFEKSLKGIPGKKIHEDLVKEGFTKKEIRLIRKFFKEKKLNNDVNGGNRA